jgi:UDP-N-acetylglucosamine diphosphorylase / glucose-1-phosphate thymidylyltransferase / UDP-N-acetylgalactosamine diphosphorylase / glucosamine-1-phosphate N-acetyltransferase / galactosamine-1-phosphate N-acetyltransferase
MIDIENYITGFYKIVEIRNKQPWELITEIAAIIENKISSLPEGFTITNLVAIHKTAVIEPNVTLKPPVIIGENCFVGANSYLRNGVWLVKNVKTGAGCEIKSSIIFENSAIAHFNFIGDSLVGNNVNFEAGSITANHYNERTDKNISSLYGTEIINTNTGKLGALVGDYSKIGANAVLAPGTVLNAGTIINRLELVEQIK